MNRKLLFSLIAIALVAVIGGGMAARKKPEGGPGGGPPGGMGGPGGPGGFGAPAVVTTQPVAQGEIEVWSEFVGTLQARAFADLYAKIPGQIVEMRAETGDRVRQGQVLARIDAGDLRQRVEQMEAALRMAQATLTERRSTLEVNQANADRSSALFAQQLISQQQQDTVQAELLKARAQVQVAQAQVEQARANLGAARAELEKTLIIAPFDGVIGKRHLDRGAFATTNQPVFSLVDLSTIKTTIPLTQKDAARIQVGQQARVTSDAFPGVEFRGQVARIASIFDPNTNTTEAEVEIANSDGRLKPGMFATVSISYLTEPTALLVPKTALVEDERETYLFVAEKGPAPDGKGEAWTAKRVPVLRIGAGSEERRNEVAIEGDVQAGQPVITLGQQELRDGATVVIAGSARPATPAG
ncbi:MAG TPA: efflux RND transporter periplasmic adaptor subunit [Thermoanaerobaculia bacterium]|nr:efflux RND transporter periplasmic adaptor subunit [Thermoanaerobaculia bacterium]